MKIEEIKRVKEDAEKPLLSKPNVVGVSIGNKITMGEDTGEICIVVLVERKLPERCLEPENLIPKTIMETGIKTDVQEVGRIKALGIVERRSRWRPCIGGISIGHVKVTAGTLGCFILKGGEVYILSNNHVLANENNKAETRAPKGDLILQPGPYDGGTSADKVAELEDWVELDFQGDNYVDVAIAKPSAPHSKYVNARIYELTHPEGMVKPILGMAVAKSGRTSGVTKGAITQLHATVTVDYESGTATFKDQVLSTPILSPGDSGSIILTEGGMFACGLGFAGSDRVSIINPIQKVFEEMKLDSFFKQASLA